MRSLLRDFRPRRKYVHLVEVEGIEIPVKEAVTKVTGLGQQDFTTNHARAASKRLGFTVRRVKREPTTARAKTDERAAMAL